MIGNIAAEVFCPFEQFVQRPPANGASRRHFDHPSPLLHRPCHPHRWLHMNQQPFKPFCPPGTPPSSLGRVLLAGGAQYRSRGMKSARTCAKDGNLVDWSHAWPVVPRSWSAAGQPAQTLGSITGTCGRSSCSSAFPVWPPGWKAQPVSLAADMPAASLCRVTALCRSPPTGQKTHRRIGLCRPGQ